MCINCCNNFQMTVDFTNEALWEISHYTLKQVLFHIKGFHRYKSTKKLTHAVPPLLFYFYTSDCTSRDLCVQLFFFSATQQISTTSEIERWSLHTEWSFNSLSYGAVITTWGRMLKTVKMIVDCSPPFSHRHFNSGILNISGTYNLQGPEFGVQHLHSHKSQVYRSCWPTHYPGSVHIQSQETGRYHSRHLTPWT